MMTIVNKPKRKKIQLFYPDKVFATTEVVCILL